LKEQQSLFEKENEYSPEEPYLFKTGRYQGRSAEVLMFRNYGYLVFILHKIRNNWQGGKKNRLHKHLEWLLDRGENILDEVKLTCPYCKEKKMAVYYSVLRSYYVNDFSIGSRYVCCENCKKSLRHQAFGKIPKIAPFKFSSIKVIARNKQEEKELGYFFQKAFTLSFKKLSTKKAFNLFKN